MRFQTQLQNPVMPAASDKVKANQWRVEEVEWNSPRFEHARSIRTAVFVEEQGFPLSEEFDDVDARAIHVVAYNEDGSPCGTARLCDDWLRPSCARIGRVAVLRQVRGKGCGKAMMKHLLAKARSLGYHKVVLSAQEHSIGFYARLGFVPTGLHYLDAHVRHQDMVHLLSGG